MSRRVERATARAPELSAAAIIGRVLGVGLGLFLAFAGASPTQDAMRPATAGEEVRLRPADAAILEAQDTRKDLPCTVTPTKPSLGFDLKFHSGYEVTINLKELAGSENLLTIVFQVAPEDRPGEPVFFSQHVSVPSIDDDDRGPADLQGAFNLGKGSTTSTG